MKNMTRLFNGYTVFDRLFEEYIKLIVHLLSLMASEKSIKRLVGQTGERVG